MADLSLKKEVVPKGKHKILVKGKIRKGGKMRKFFKMVSIGVFFVMVLLIYGQVVPIDEWIVRYNSLDNGEDSPHAIAVDSCGNVYVTGYNSSGWCTVKYDTNGNQLWVAEQPGSGSGIAIAVDLSGNVYITGFAQGNNSIVKYDTNGNQLWVAGGFPLGEAIAVDSSGNVYVTGWGSGADGYQTVAYDTNGNQLWIAQYNGPGPGTDIPHAIAVDSSGNVYVTGQSDEGSGTSTDYATVAYDTNGNELWIARYNGPANYRDMGNAIAVDSSGNVYVTGISDWLGNNPDIVTIAYDSNGTQLWVAQYNGPDNSDDGAYDIAVDSFGKIYVTGWTWGSVNDYDFCTIQYNRNGDELWVAQYNGPANGEDWAEAIAVDSFENVYVTGISYVDGPDYDFATIAYDTNGNELWAARYNGPGNDEDWAYDIAVDSYGNVYVTGDSVGSGTDYDWATVKYSQKIEPSNQVASLISYIQAMVDSGELSLIDANPLITKLEGVIEKLLKENTKAACGQLGAFINQVNEHIWTGKLSSEHGQHLLESANRLSSEICN